MPRKSNIRFTACRRLEFVQRVFFELFEIGDGEFAHDGDVDEVLVFLDGDHVRFS